MTPRSALSLAVMTLLGACTPEPSPRATPPAPAAASSTRAAPSTDVAASASATSDASNTTADADAGVVGTLVVAKGEKGRKSLEAWLGRFKVVDGEREVRVFASSAVSEDALEKWSGKRVRVRGERVAPSTPDPNEQAPLGPDGKLMMRPGGLRVQSIEAAP